MPIGDEWAYEPKYDGFRALAFVDGEELLLQSRGGKPLQRYFPELRFPPGRYILDGEIVIDADPARMSRGLRCALTADPPGRVADRAARRADAGALRRLRPARRGRRGTHGGAVRRTARAGSRGSRCRTSRWRRRSRTAAEAEPWLRRTEGVVAKDLRAAYAPGKRTAMVKVKRVRTIDAVIAGYRPGKEAGTVGSLILGLYDEAGQLRIVGHCSGIKSAEKRALRERPGSV